MEVETPDFIQAGTGERVILIHSSVAGLGQWRSLTEKLADRYHVIAFNMFGYGKTSAWDGISRQRLQDQARLAEPFLPSDGGKVSIVGHSFGGSVAMMAAALYKRQIRRLVLVEPNPFYLLDQHGRGEAFQEAVDLRDSVRTHGASGAWEIAAEKFVNYWTGQGSWDAMTDDRKLRFIRGLRPNFHEWDAVMDARMTLQEWADALPADTTVLSAADTVRSIDEIVDLMKENVPAWTFEQIARGGHMAAVTKPDVVNPIVERALR